jgi:mono/diheme cytochrome c family protein
VLYPTDDHPRQADEGAASALAIPSRTPPACFACASADVHVVTRSFHPRALTLPWLCLLSLVAGCGDADRPGAQVATRATQHMSAEDLAEGEALFNQFCVQCHGPAATGTAQGPPLVHRVYEPRHHSDFAFMLAIRQGVRAHHWRFGDMPPVEGITDEQAQRVIAYIRHLQQAAGIF